MAETTPFYIRDCNLSLVSTGKVAESLVELKDLLYRIEDSSLYYHFWGGRLRISFVHPEYHNDFAKWAHVGLHDDILTERLTIIDPTEFPNLSDLRKKVIDVVEDRLEEVEYLLWSRKEYKFHFLKSILIVFNTGITVAAPPDLKGIIPKLTFTSIFYHFIDARSRTPEQLDDFSYWLSSFGDTYKELINKLKLIDPYFLSLSEIRQELEVVFQEYFK